MNGIKMYQAIVTKLTNIRKHPNADRLKLATCHGYQIIIGLDQQEGDLGVFFPCDGQISKEHALRNKLYTKHPDTGEPMGGYFSKHARVKAQRFRGEISDGFWMPVEDFKWTGSIKKLVEGYQFDILNGHRICQKYYTPATQRAMRERDARKGKGINMKINRSMLHEHTDTLQIRHHIQMIPEGAILYLTEKCHGTSGRTGLIKSVYPLGKFKRWCNKYLRTKFDNSKWEYVTGTRRVVLDPSICTDTGYYSGTQFRQKIHRRLSNMGLQKGEVLYYEIVGYDDLGRPIMPAHTIEDKKMQKLYGDKMYYSYGCKPEKETITWTPTPTKTEEIEMSKQWEIYVYRIAHINEDGHEVDLCWPQVQKRCKQLGLKCVPPLEKGPIVHTTQEALLEKLKVLADGPSTIDNSHIREGVVVRVEHENMFEFLKYKGYWFCELEQIMKNSDEFIDPEEVE